MSRDSLADALSTRRFLTFGGNETYLLFVQKYPLREFCAFEVAQDESAWKPMEEALLRPIADAAAAGGFGLITDCMVWRASPDYVARLGFAEQGVARVNQLAVARTRRFVDEWRGTSDAAGSCPVIVAADLGPRGDGYVISGDQPIPVAEAYDYHAAQVDALAAAGIDLLVALTMTSRNETIGVIRAADRAGLPVLVSPTVETDGRLPDGSLLGDFVSAVDDVTGGSPVGFMVNCAHPDHIAPTLRAAAEAGAGWLTRFRGLRANASRKSHAELDNSVDLDRGDPSGLAGAMAELQRAHAFTIIGGCCGTDAEHLRAMAAACQGR